MKKIARSLRQHRELEISAQLAMGRGTIVRGS
jgi:hypothetical protein